MSSDSERHCCTLFQTQAFQACLRLHSPHRAPRLHRSAQALFLQRRSHFSPSNGDTVGNASSFGSLSPFPGTMSCRRVWSSAVAHPCHRTNAAPCQFATSLTQGAANATSVCQSLARGWWVPSPPLHRRLAAHTIPRHLVRAYTASPMAPALSPVLRHTLQVQR